MFLISRVKLWAEGLPLCFSAIVNCFFSACLSVFTLRSSTIRFSELSAPASILEDLARRIAERLRGGRRFCRDVIADEDVGRLSGETA